MREELGEREESGRPGRCWGDGGMQWGFTGGCNSGEKTDLKYVLEVELMELPDGLDVVAKGGREGGRSYPLAPCSTLMVTDRIPVESSSQGVLTPNLLLRHLL